MTYLLEQWFQIEAPRSYFNDQVEGLRRCLVAERPGIEALCREKARRQPKSLLLLVGEADGLNYGPVNASFGMARRAKRDFPDWRVGILFTDRHRLDAADFVAPADRPVSSRYQDELRAKLGDERIELMFAPEGERRARTAATVDLVRTWGPAVLCSVADDRDLARGLLFDDYPTIEVHIGGMIMKPDDADVALTAFDVEQREALFDFFGVGPDVRARFETFLGTIEVGQPQRAHSRAEHGLPDDAFVLAIVGYNIEQILTTRRLRFLAALMEAHPQVHLVLVGKKELPAVVGQLGSDLAKRVRVLGKLNDLAGFFTICDAVFCPRQRGAGFTHCTAVGLGIPTVVEYAPLGDVTANVGRAFTFEGEDALRDALDRVITEEAYRADLVRRGHEAIEERKAISERCVGRLFEEFFPLAEARFRARVATSSSESLCEWTAPSEPPLEAR